MKQIIDYITEAQRVVSKDCPGWSFCWIKVKDRWASRAEAKMKFSLVCIPNDKSKEIIVFRDYAWYTRGYDQGHASSYNYYLNTIIGGERGNGHGVDKEYEPFDGDLMNDLEDLGKYLKDGKYWSTSGTEKLDKVKMTFEPKTKLSEIKKEITGW